MKHAVNEVEYETSAEQRTVNGWCCTKCNRYWGDDEHMARYCCCTSMMCKCGRMRHDRHWARCKKCREERKFTQWCGRLDLAEDVTDSYDGPVVVERGMQYGEWPCEGTDCWFTDLESAKSYVEKGDHEEIWGFAADSRVRQLDLDGAIECMCDDAYEGMADHLIGIDELRSAVDKFNKENEQNATVWDIDYSRKIRVR